MKTLNDRYNYGLDLFLLSIDEGITGYRDDSLEVHIRPHTHLIGKVLIPFPFQTVKRNQQQYNLPLKILSYDELYGWTMDAIVEKIGRKNNCACHFNPTLPLIHVFICMLRRDEGTFCGVFRRQALDRGAASLNVDHIVTGHNADDIAETVLMNSEPHLEMPLPSINLIQMCTTNQSCGATSPVSDAVPSSVRKEKIP